MMRVDFVVNVLTIAIIAVASAFYFARSLRRDAVVQRPGMHAKAVSVVPRAFLTAMVGFAAAIIGFFQLRDAATGTTPTAFSTEALRAQADSVRISAVSDSIVRTAKQRERSDELMHEGIRLASNGRARSALAYYDSAIVANPSNAEAYNYKGFALFVLGEKQDALSTMQRGVAIDSTNPWAFYNIALAYMATGDTVAGIRAIERTLRIDGSFAEILKGDPQYRRIKNLPAVAALLRRG